MSYRAKDYIPEDILAAARAAGLTTPVGYAGRSNGHEKLPEAGGLGEIIERQLKDSGLTLDRTHPAPGLHVPPRRSRD